MGAGMPSPVPTAEAIVPPVAPVSIPTMPVAPVVSPSVIANTPAPVLDPSVLAGMPTPDPACLASMSASAAPNMYSIPHQGVSMPQQGVSMPISQAYSAVQVPVFNGVPAAQPVNLAVAPTMPQVNAAM